MTLLLDDHPTVSAGISRREFLTGAAALVVLGACGQSADRTPKGRGSQNGFPITVDHRYGSTEIPGAPQRVVTVGLVDHDAVLALGVKPVGITAGEWASDYPSSVGPWAQEKLGNAQPEVLPDSAINFEKIAVLNPDLITAAYSGLTEEEFQTLSRIAPTVAQSGNHADYGTPWSEMTRAIGRALGKLDDAERLVAGVESRFEKARNDHPEFAGASAVYAGVYDKGYYAESLQSSRIAILTSLGFKVPEEVTTLAGDRFFADIGPERIDLLDQDVLMWEIGDNAEAKAAVVDNPLYQQLNVSRQGRDIFVEDRVVAAGLAFISVLSLPFVIDRLVPLLAAAVDGDPATRVTAGTVS
jgi:iron complex transport system substrate-binding protein